MALLSVGKVQGERVTSYLRTAVSEFCRCFLSRSNRVLKCLRLTNISPSYKMGSHVKWKKAQLLWFTPGPPHKAFGWYPSMEGEILSWLVRWWDSIYIDMGLTSGNRTRVSWQGLPPLPLLSLHFLFACLEQPLPHPQPWSQPIMGGNLYKLWLKWSSPLLTVGVRYCVPEKRM